MAAEATTAEGGVQDWAAIKFSGAGGWGVMTRWHHLGILPPPPSKSRPRPSPPPLYSANKGGDVDCYRSRPRGKGRADAFRRCTISMSEERQPCTIPSINDTVPPLPLPKRSPIRHSGPSMMINSASPILPDDQYASKLLTCMVVLVWLLLDFSAGKIMIASLRRF